MGWNNVPPNGFPQIPDIEDLEAVVNDVAGLKTSKANKAEIAPTFSATSNYAVGDLVYYEGTLYKCTTAHDAAAWNAEHFTETTIEAEIAAVQGDVSDLNSTKVNQITIAPFFSSETAYDPGDLVYYNGLTYRCTNAHEGAWDAQDFAATTIANEISSLESGLTNLFLRKTIIVGDITIPSSKNYYQISSQVIDPPTGYTAIAVNIYDWTSAPTPISATFTRSAFDSVYIMGASSTVITGLKIEVIFVKSDMISVAT